MFETIIQPRFSETDALTHIGNTVMPVWFEEARRPIFEKINPGMAFSNWPGVLAHLDVDFLKQVFVGKPVTIKVGVSDIGNRSFTVYHEAYQNKIMVAKGHAVMVFYDFDKQESRVIPDEKRQVLEELRFSD